jgi:2-haloalkanoic acid dehalogenase type II
MSENFVTFDCYGTLIDWERGIGDAFMSLAARQGWNATREGILAAYHQVEPVVEGEQYRTYRETLAEAARRVLRTFGWELPEEERDFLAASLGEWQPFADTGNALERLRAKGARLGILSNVDDDLLEQSMRHFPVRFDLVVTAQQVRSYKPGLGHFLTAREKVGTARWLHAAQSYFHDIVPCAALGIPSVWVNRNGDHPTQEARASREVRNLTELADLLGV